MTDSLVTFLDHRIDEDERAAEAAAEGERAHWRAVTTGDPETTLVRDGENLSVGSWMSDEDAAFVGRYDPARALSEARAKRARLADWEYSQAKLDDAIANLGKYSAGDEGMWLGATRVARMACLRDAAVYSDHPDYHPDWMLPPSPPRSWVTGQ